MERQGEGKGDTERGCLGWERAASSAPPPGPGGHSTCPITAFLPPLSCGQKDLTHPAQVTDYQVRRF